MNTFKVPLKKKIGPMMSELSDARQQLIRAMQWLNFGDIENLKIMNGEPDWSHPPTFVRLHKFQAAGGATEYFEQEDFILKDCVIELLAQIDELGNAEVRAIKVLHGLPFTMTYEDFPQ